LLTKFYREFTYDGLQHTSILQIDGMKENGILIDSISKRYSACGARIGLVASKNKEVMAACLKFAQARLSSPTIEQWGAKAALKWIRLILNRFFKNISADETL
jgi:aspartate aminotransferase